MTKIGMSDYRRVEVKSFPIDLYNIVLDILGLSRSPGDVGDFIIDAVRTKTNELMKPRITPSGNTWFEQRMDEILNKKRKR